MYAHEIPRLEADFERITEDIRQKNLRLQRVTAAYAELRYSLAHVPFSCSTGGSKPWDCGRYRIDIP